MMLKQSIARVCLPVLAAAACLSVLFSGSAGAQETQPVQVQWQAVDLDGKPAAVPGAGKTSVVLFVMSDQAHSLRALKQAQELLATRAGVQVIAVVSGDQAEARARKLGAEIKWPWPVVADEKYEASGRMLVRVWPTTVVVRADGTQTAHLGGCPPAYAKDLDAWLLFTAGQLDRAGLDARLASHAVVSSTATDVGNRHLHLAQRLIDQGSFAEARAELEKGIKASPTDSALPLALCRLDLLANNPAAALKRLDELDAAKLAPWKVLTLRGRILVAMGKWDDARATLTEALKVNPEPAEVHYALGVVHEHQQDWKRAAEAFRKAFETSPSGRLVNPASGGVGR